MRSERFYEYPAREAVQKTGPGGKKEGKVCPPVTVRVRQPKSQQERTTVARSRIHSNSPAVLRFPCQLLPHPKAPWRKDDNDEMIKRSQACQSRARCIHFRNPNVIQGRLDTLLPHGRSSGDCRLRHGVMGHMGRMRLLRRVAGEHPACGRCLSAGAALERFYCDFDRAGARCHVGINICRTPHAARRWGGVRKAKSAALHTASSSQG